MSEQNELKPCPFCDGEAELVETDRIPRLFAVWCKKCHVATGKRTNKIDVIAIWNRRVADERKTDEQIANIYRRTFGGMAAFVANEPEGVPPMVIEFARALMGKEPT